MTLDRYYKYRINATIKQHGTEHNSPNKHTTWNLCSSRNSTFTMKIYATFMCRHIVSLLTGYSFLHLPWHHCCHHHLPGTGSQGKLKFSLFFPIKVFRGLFYLMTQGTIIVETWIISPHDQMLKQNHWSLIARANSWDPSFPVFELYQQENYNKLN